MLDDFTSKASKYITDNSPSILTGIGVAGTIATAVLTGKASFKAAEVIHKTTIEKKDTLDTREKLKVVWTLYIPSATTAGLTVAAIIAANKVSLNRTAAMAAAFQTSQSMFGEYKSKVIERVGADREEKIRADIAQDRVNRRPVSASEVIITGGGDVLCYDHYSGRYFQSSVEAIKKAMNDTNYQCLNHGDQSLADFYNRLGLSGTMFAQDVGWTSMDILDIKFDTTMSDDQRPCIAIEYNVVPIRNYGG